MKKTTFETLREKRQAILSLWEKRVLQEIPPAIGQSSPALRNSLSTLLDQIEESLKGVADLKTSREKSSLSAEFGARHGMGRAGIVNYSIEQVIYEFHIFREIIFRVLETDAPLSQQERDLILSKIEAAVNISATHFSLTLKTIRERLVTALTHDLRTPVTSTLLSAQLLSKYSGNKNYCEKTAFNITRNMYRLDQMIRDLLDASRIGAGEKLDLKLESMDLDLLIQEVITDSKLLYGERFVYCSPGPTDGHWSYDGLHRVLENLLSNAAKYSYPKTAITLSLAANEREIELKAHNECDPISPEQMGILFQQFRRFQTDSKKQGWGIGLLLVKGIVEAHKGTITVETSSSRTREGNGITFLIKLPRIAANTANETIVQPSEKSRIKRVS